MIPSLVLTDSTDFPDKIKVSIGDKSEFYILSKKGDCDICGRESSQIMKDWDGSKVINYCKGCFNAICR